ncbi:LPXTG cell wall anchor domain-containing protein [Staphylococcus sp. GSSP0090]|nr:LPXTG cell wall anchor domain-containing protein [Staphylococcus sp. GSSP0090]
MKKIGVIGSITLASTILFTGINVNTHTANAAEKKVPIYVFTESEFYNNQTDEKDGYGGGPGSGVRIAKSNETYQQYLNRVKSGEQLNESVGNIEYVYPDQTVNQNSQQETVSEDSVRDSSNASKNEQQETGNKDNVSDSSTVSENKQQETVNEKSQTLPNTGEESNDKAAILMIATMSLLSGLYLIIRKFSKKEKQ